MIVSSLRHAKDPLDKLSAPDVYKVPLSYVELAKTADAFDAASTALRTVAIPTHQELQRLADDAAESGQEEVALAWGVESEAELDRLIAESTR